MEKLGIQIIQLSRERIRCPLTSDVIHFGKQVGDRTGIISVRYGKRMLSTATPLPLDKLTQDVFVEVVDYDPVKNGLMFIGEQQPDVQVAIHWILLRVREDVNVLVHLHKERGGVTTPLERAKMILGSIKGDGHVFKEKEESLLLGKGFADVIKMMEEM